MINLFLADATSAQTRKWEIYLIVILLFLVCVIGLAVGKIREKVMHNAKVIDIYVKDYCEQNILNKPRDVFRYVIKRELRETYIESRIYLRIFLIGLAIFSILMATAFKDHTLAESFKLISDLFGHYDWHKVRFFRTIKIPTDFPTMLEKPKAEGSAFAITTYLMFVISVVSIVVMLIRGFEYTGKVSRAKQISIDAFGKTIDTTTK